MKHFDKPIKLSFKYHDIEVSIEIDKDDLTVVEFYEKCKHLALAVGYPSKIVNEYFTE